MAKEYYDYNAAEFKNKNNLNLLEQDIKQKIKNGKNILSSINFNKDAYRKKLFCYFARIIADYNFIKPKNYNSNPDILFAFALLLITKEKYDNKGIWDKIQNTIEPIINEINAKNGISSEFKITQKSKEKIAEKLTNTLKEYNLLLFDENEDIEEMLKFQCFVTQNNENDYFEFLKFFYKKNIWDMKRKYPNNEDIEDIKSAVKTHLLETDNLNKTETQITVENAISRCLRVASRKVLYSAPNELIQKLFIKYLGIFAECYMNYNEIENIKNKYKKDSMELRLCEWCKDNIPPKERYNKENQRGDNRDNNISNPSPYLAYDSENDIFYIVIPKLKIRTNSQSLKISIISNDKINIIEPIIVDKYTKNIGFIQFDDVIEEQISPEFLFKNKKIVIQDDNGETLFNYDICNSDFIFFTYGGNSNQFDCVEINKFAKSKGYGECFLLTDVSVKTEIEERFLDEENDNDIFKKYVIDVRREDTEIYINGIRYFINPPKFSEEAPYVPKYIKPDKYYYTKRTDNTEITISLSHPRIDLYNEKEKNSSIWLKQIDIDENENKIEKNYEIKLSDFDFPIKQDENNLCFTEIDIEKCIKDDNFHKKNLKYTISPNKDYSKSICSYFLIEDLYFTLDKELYTDEKTAIISSEKYMKKAEETQVKCEKKNSFFEYSYNIEQGNNKALFYTDLYNYDFSEDDDNRYNYYILNIPFKQLKYSLDPNSENISLLKPNINNIIWLDKIGDYLYVDFAGDAIKTKMYIDKNNSNTSIELPCVYEENNQGFRIFSTENLDNVKEAFYGVLYLEFYRNHEYYKCQLGQIVNQPIIEKKPEIKIENDIPYMDIQYKEIEFCKIWIKIINKNLNEKIYENILKTGKTNLSEKLNNTDTYEIRIFMQKDNGEFIRNNENEILYLFRDKLCLNSDFKFKTCHYLKLNNVKYDGITANFLNNHKIINIKPLQQGLYSGDLFIHPCKNPINICFQIKKDNGKSQNGIREIIIQMLQKNGDLLCYNKTYKSDSINITKQKTNIQLPENANYTAYIQEDEEYY